MLFIKTLIQLINHPLTKVRSMEDHIPPQWDYMLTHTHIYIYIHTYIYIFTYIYIYTYTYIYIYIYICNSIYIYMYIYMYNILYIPCQIHRIHQTPRPMKGSGLPTSSRDPQLYGGQTLHALPPPLVHATTQLLESWQLRKSLENPRGYIDV